MFRLFLDVALKESQRKQNFSKPREPRGAPAKNARRRFVVHEHHASRLHFDFRLEMAGVLKSWAVPKGPSLDPRDKRLAVAVPDHSVRYIDFEGEIAEGAYGAGQVRVWDNGTYDLVEPFDPLEQLDAGKLSFVLHGKTLRGEFTLVKLANRDKQWLLIKKDDGDAKRGWRIETILKDAENARPARKKKARVGENGNAPLSERVLESPTRTRASVADDAHDDYADARGPDTLRVRRRGKTIIVRGVEKSKMPRVIEPMLATLVNKPFVDAEWIFETKWDGVRALCFIEKGKARFVSRSQQDITFRYPELKTLPNAVDAERALLDGEIVVFDKKGASRFQLLQQRIGVVEQADIAARAAQHHVTYCVFDLLYCDDSNLMRAALLERKTVLQAILKRHPNLKFSAHTARDGEKALAAAARKQLEGIVAKHKLSPYVQRRSSRWLKIKTQLRQEVVIGGYTEPKGSREHFGALVVGVYDDGELKFVGNVGGGFNRKALKQTFATMQKYKTKKSPFANGTQPNDRVQWLKPKLVGEVKFAEWTAGAQMRQPIFMGLRDDKAPHQVHFEHEHETKRQVKKAERQDRARGKRARKTLVAKRTPK